MPTRPNKVLSLLLASLLLSTHAFAQAGPDGADRNDGQQTRKIVLSEDDYDVGGEKEEDVFAETADGNPSMGLPGSDDSVLGPNNGEGARQAGSSWEDMFEVSLDVFDGIVLAGQAGARTMGAGLPGSPSAGQQGSPGGTPGTPGAAGSPTGSSPGAAGGAEGQAGQESRIPAPPGQSQSGGAGGGGESAGGAGRSGSSSGQGQAANVPEDIPDGDDDDLIARQIREAAERETDPELRDKLWDEYRKYKNNQR